MKNFFLKQARKHNTIKKMTNHIEYLIDNNRKAHYDTQIYSITDDVNSNHRSMVRELESHDKHKKENGGGRASQATTTYILSLPEDLIHPTDEQWKEIYNQTIDNFCEFINENQQRKEDIGFTGSNEKYRKSIEQYNAIRLDSDTFKRNSVAVVHNESNAQEKASHVHIITSNVQNGQYLKMLNQTAGQSFIKKSYDKAVKNVLGLDPLKYIPKIDRLSKPDQDKLDLADEEQFKKRMKDNPKYETTDKGVVGGRKRRRRTKCVIP